MYKCMFCKVELKDRGEDLICPRCGKVYEKLTPEEERLIEEQRRNVPHCPTCNSTNVQKISSTKRFVSTGLFGLASSNLGKTMECKNCGYKW